MSFLLALCIYIRLLHAPHTRSHAQYERSACSIDADNYPCENGGNCTDPGYWGTFDCACPDGVIGERCEIVTDACFFSPCLNGGSCNATGDGDFDFTCSCGPRYTGETCDERIECEDNCFNGATCNDDDLPLSCVCAEGFVGAQCKYLEGCVASPCENGGTCVTLDDGGFLCLCTRGWVNSMCQTSYVLIFGVGGTAFSVLAACIGFYVRIRWYRKVTEDATFLREWLLKQELSKPDSAESPVIFSTNNLPPRCVRVFSCTEFSIFQR